MWISLRKRKPMAGVYFIMVDIDGSATYACVNEDGDIEDYNGNILENVVAWLREPLLSDKKLKKLI